MHGYEQSVRQRSPSTDAAARRRPTRTPGTVAARPGAGVCGSAGTTLLSTRKRGCLVCQNGTVGGGDVGWRPDVCVGRWAGVKSVGVRRVGRRFGGVGEAALPATRVM